MCVTDRHDMTLAVTVALNPSTTNQLDKNSYKYRRALKVYLTAIINLIYNFSALLILTSFSTCLTSMASGEHVGLMTWWLWVWYAVEVNFLYSVFSPLTSAEACEKSSRWLWKESCVSTVVRKPGSTCVSPTTMILAVKVAHNTNTSRTNHSLHGVTQISVHIICHTKE